MSFFDFLKKLLADPLESLNPPPTPVKIVPETPFALGGMLSPFDYRDVPFAAVASVTPLDPIYIEDITALDVWNQKSIGSCVGHAAAKYKQYLEYLETGNVINLSPRFLYALAKCRDGWAGEGTYPRLVAGIVKDIGVATQDTIPNNSELSHEQYVYNRNEASIPNAAFVEARKYSIKSYAFPDVKSVEELKRGIKQGRGTMLLMRIGKEWWTNKNGQSSWGENDIIPLKAPKEIVSGHEVYLYGYENVGNRTKFYVFNSWSVLWGKSGKAWFWHDEYKPFLDEAITFVDLPNTWLEQLHQLPTKENFKYTFKNQLKLGQRNNDVKALQTALLIEGLFSADLYKDLMKDPKGLGYYGDATRRAVLAFQTKHHVDSQPVIDLLAGKEIGPKTRAKLNKLYS